MPHPPLPSTQSAVLAVEAMAARHAREVSTTHDIGRDRTFAGLVGTDAAGAGADELAAIPHEALVEIAGPPEVTVRLFVHDEALVTVEHVPFDVPRDSVPAFLNSVWTGLVHVRQRVFPPSCTMIVTVPGEPSYREPVTALTLTPWLTRRIR
ncbi:hypothetical protein ACIPYS_04750 [Kitasatospora sp. NPDC089913]|uniref:hypothetical protein n=1 Tax=Streptomycetaceae TaxID=2062 RepID=UPI00087AAFBD|nr:hypothetical protein [Streptomyces sp. TLI_053]SDT82135.1 hypothetical protein SAMN05216371_6991 [Streptomyces sp. TLI_053]